MDLNMSKKSLSDKITNSLSLSATILFIALVVLLVSSLLWNSSSSIQRFGLSFFTSTNWNVKFLELSRVQLKNDSFYVTFTVALQEDDFNALVSLSSDGQKIEHSSLLSRNSLVLTPLNPISDNGDYTINLASELKDESGYELGQDITWTGTLKNKKLIKPKILGSQTGVISGPTQNENERHFGILPFIMGTVLSSIIALFIAFPIAMAVALYLTEFSHPDSKFAKTFAILIDLLAGIPSIIFGLWGLFFIVPRFGANLGTASLVLAIMIMPYAASLTKEAISLVPDKLKQAGFGLGASRYKVIKTIMLPYARSGIIAGMLLTLGRALGETLAVTMVIGNRNQIPTSLSDPAQTIASLIANEYGEASGLKQSALIEAGFVLIVITLVFSLLGRFFIRYMNDSHQKNEVIK